MHHPFTMPMEEDWDKIDTDPGAVRAKAYDIVLNGTELGGGSVRIHQDDIQEKMFEVLGFTKERAHEQFGFLLDAFKYGVPPHAGLAYGLDRLVMHMVHAESIRDVIAFPKVKDASCLMTKAPGIVDEKQLEELNIKTLEVEEEEQKIRFQQKRSRYQTHIVFGVRDKIPSVAETGGILGSREWGNEKNSQKSQNQSAFVQFASK